MFYSYVYPDEVKYLGIKEEDIPVFIEDQIVKGEISTRLRHESVSGKYLATKQTEQSNNMNKNNYNKKQIK